MDEEGETFDDGGLAFIAPRLATFAEDSNVDGTVDDLSPDELNNDRDTVLDSVMVLGKESDADPFSNLNEEAEEAEYAPVSTAQAMEMFLNDDEDDALEPEESEGGDEPLVNDVDFDEEDDNDIGDESPGAGEAKARTPFALSRVKDLLKFHSASSIVARDAAVTASEAVGLILNDMARLAAAEAQRHQRKVVTYADLSRVVHLMDRFSFLADVIPPLPAASSAAKVVVGAARAGTRAKRVHASSEAAKGIGGQQAKREYPGSQLRQATLRF